MMPENVSMIAVELGRRSRRPTDAAMTDFTDSSATANIVTSVTPMTTPIAMRLERSG